MFSIVSGKLEHPRSNESGRKNTIKSLPITIKFINEENKSLYKKTVLTWLESDFKKRGKPLAHFWHNRSTIKEAFDRCDAMVALNSQEEFIGYMIWHFYSSGVGAEIDIIEVKENYQKQGVFKKALTAFSDKFTNVRVLSALVLQQAEKAFCSVGWEKWGKKHIKIIKPPVLRPLDTLPDGQVIAVCSENYYEVEANREKYKSSMRYFQIKLGKDGQLHEPIVTNHCYEGYIGVYFNKKLIADGKARHLFLNIKEDVSTSRELLILTEIIPQEPELFKEFFSGFQQEVKHPKYKKDLYFSTKAINVNQPSTTGLEEDIGTETTSSEEDKKVMFGRGKTKPISQQTLRAKVILPPRFSGESEKQLSYIVREKSLLK